MTIDELKENIAKILNEAGDNGLDYLPVINKEIDKFCKSLVTELNQVFGEDLLK